MYSQSKVKSKTVKASAKTTAPKRTTAKRGTSPKSTNPEPSETPIPANYQTEEIAEQKNICLSDIELCPTNYRRYFSSVSLAELSADIALHGMLSPVTIRTMPSGRYELVIGERRIRAARMISLATVPAVIKAYSDEMAKEVRLSENIHRENPHPLDESIAISEMQQDGKSIEEISARLGKSKSYVYSRIRLAQLVPALQDVFYADKMSIVEATELASLAAESQTEFFEQHCMDWENENFSIHAFKSIITRFKYDLTKAPFDLQDGKLIPKAGACVNCPFNSATLNSLFPESATIATCSNKACYKDKCLAHSTVRIIALVQDFKPDAILFSGQPSEEDYIVISSLEETVGLPHFSHYEVYVIQEPVQPDREDYQGYIDEDEESEIEAFDQVGYDAALEEYKEDLNSYRERIAAGDIRKALYINWREIQQVYYTDRNNAANLSPKKITAKEVQDAIKAGEITMELLKGEQTRLTEREARAKEIDRDKVQTKIHEQLSIKLESAEMADRCTSADLAAARLLIYQSLNYQNRSLVHRTIFIDQQGEAVTDRKLFYDQLSNLSEEQYCFMIRLALAGNSESKLPNDLNGIALYQVADQSGINVQEVEKQQAAIAKKRLKKLKPRIKAIEARVKRLTAQEQHNKAA